MTENTPSPTPEPPVRSNTTGSITTALPPSAAARQRLLQRQSTASLRPTSPRPDPLLRRRSSLLSYSSLDDASHSFDDIVNPRTGKRPAGNLDNELSHWHSSPLAFAILPAIGGLLFKNGSAFVTDALLLGLAAIFLNWSIRLPWDWYFAAQERRCQVEPNEDAIAADLEDETAVETASSAEASPKPSPNRKRQDSVNDEDAPVRDVSRREEAAEQLRRVEIVSLAATFIFPALAAYLLHIIRAQLTTASTVLVSDTNLSIFLLGAEVQPFRQLIRLVSERTLYLQRVVTGIDDPLSGAVEEKSTIATLATRIQELESKLADNTLVPQTTSMAQKTDINDLSVEIRKRYEPRVEGLERAVRRYEKRQTTIAIQTEQRLQMLEARTQDAVSLAAAAAQNSQNGFVTSTFQTMGTIVGIPANIAWQVGSWPFKVLDDMYVRLKTLMLGPMPARSSAKRKSGRRDGSATRDESRTRDKGHAGAASVRKVR